MNAKTASSSMLKGMSRQSFLRLMLTCVMLLVLMAVLVYRYIQKQNLEIEDNRAQLMELEQELSNMAKLAQTLDQLDELTIDEKTATRLNLMRHLGLEQSGYTFTLSSKTEKQVGDAVLHIRNITFNGDMPYAVALGLLDRLHNTKKIGFTNVYMSASSQAGDMVTLSAEGSMYGLNKQ